MNSNFLEKNSLTFPKKTVINFQREKISKRKCLSCKKFLLNKNFKRHQKSCSRPKKGNSLCPICFSIMLKSNVSRHLAKSHLVFEDVR